MKSPITVEFTAINTKGNNSYKEIFEITTEQELIDAVKEFDKNVTFRKYEMETYAVHVNGKDLTKKEKAWFTSLDQKENIGFL